MKRMQYVQACKAAQDYVEALVEDPMTVAMHAPVDEIIEGYMRKHVHACRDCEEASIEASMP